MRLLVVLVFVSMVLAAYE
jgi:hypothetical protein